MTFMGFLTLLAFGFGGGYKWKNDECKKHGCPAVQIEQSAEQQTKE